MESWHKPSTDSAVMFSVNTPLTLTKPDTSLVPGGRLVAGGTLPLLLLPVLADAYVTEPIVWEGGKKSVTGNHAIILTLASISSPTIL